MLSAGMVSATFRTKTTDDVLALCQTAGLSGIEWSENCHVLSADPLQAGALAESTRKSGLAVAAYGSYFYLGENETPVTVFRRSLESAHALGAPVIRVWAGRKPSCNVDVREFQDICREARILAGEALAYGCHLSFEWHKNSLTDTNAVAEQLLKTINHPNVYCLWQPTLVLSEQERLEGIRMLGGLLDNFHVYHWSPEGRQELSDGAKQWKTYFKACSPGKKRYALLEFVKDNAEAQFLKDAACLHSILSEII